MKSVAHIDFEEVARNYITGNDSIPALARFYGLSPSMLFRRCKEGEWVAKRFAYRAELLNKSVSMTQEQAVAKFNTLNDVSDTLDELLVKFSKLYLDAQNFDIRQGRSQPCREMAELSKAFKTAIDAKRDLYGIPNQAELERQRVARERLQIDRDKAETDRAKAEKGPEPIVVTIEGGLEDLAK